MSYYDDNEEHLINQGAPSRGTIHEFNPYPVDEKEVKKIKKQRAKYPIFSKGYDPVRDRISKGSRFTMSCFNCDYFYQAMCDTEEVCQNPEVLQYDMVVSENSIFCNRWKISHRNSEKTIFKSKTRR